MVALAELESPVRFGRHVLTTIITQRWRRRYRNKRKKRKRRGIQRRRERETYTSRNDSVTYRIRAFLNVNRWVHTWPLHRSVRDEGVYDNVYVRGLGQIDVGQVQRDANRAKTMIDGGQDRVEIVRVT